MGNSKSKSTAKAEALNKLMVSIVNSVVAKCAAMVSQDQVLDYSGNTGTIDLSGSTFSQSASIDLKCALNVNNKAAIAHSISNALNQTAAATNAFGTGTSRANTEAKVTNTVNNAISNMTEMSVTANISQRQRMNFSNNSGKIIMRNTTVSQSATIVAQGIVDAINNTGITMEIATAITQDTSADNSVLGGIFGDWATIAIIIIMVIVCSLIALGVWMVWPDNTPKPQQPSRQPPRQQQPQQY